MRLVRTPVILGSQAPHELTDDEAYVYRSLNEADRRQTFTRLANVLDCEEARPAVTLSEGGVTQARTQSCEE
jgi:hypothetical protein